MDVPPAVPEMGMDTPPMEDNMGEDPMAMNDDPMEMEGEPETPTEGDDSTMAIINQLSDEDKKSVRAYAESMLDKNAEEDNIPEDNGEEMAPAVPEGRTFTKKQLKEEFGVKVDDVETKKVSQQPKQKTIKKNSPFNPPMFN